MVNLTATLGGSSVTITKVEFLGSDVIITFIDASGNSKTIKKAFSEQMIIATSVVAA